MNETNTNAPIKAKNNRHYYSNRHYYGGGKLGCYNHPDRPAVAQCQRCHKGLCRECADLYSPIVCAECAEIYNAEDAKKNKTFRHIDMIVILLLTLFIFEGSYHYGIITKKQSQKTAACWRADEWLYFFEDKRCFITYFINNMVILVKRFII